MDACSDIQHVIIIFEKTMNKRKKRPQFKNPFDIEDEEEEQIIPIHQPPSQQLKIHNPLPFNPYVIENNQKSQPITQPVQPSKPKPQVFVPEPVEKKVPEEKIYQLNEDGDPPLLEDIGIDPSMIKERIFMVLRVGKPTEEMIEDPDLSGPILIALCFGMLLLLSGKVHFGDIYAIFIVGNTFVYFLFNFMSQVQIIPLYNVMSTVGYGLLPMLILGFFGVFISMKSTSGILLSLGIALWSSIAASNIMGSLMKETTNDRRALLIYPLFLFYLSFAMIVIF